MSAVAAPAPLSPSCRHTFHCDTCEVTWESRGAIPFAWSVTAEELFRREHRTHQIEVMREDVL